MHTSGGVWVPIGVIASAVAAARQAKRASEAADAARLESAAATRPQLRTVDGGPSSTPMPLGAAPNLQERELIELAALSAALAGTLRQRGVRDPAATLAAEAGIAVFKVAFQRWLDQPGDSDFPRVVHDAVAELKTVMAG